MIVARRRTERQHRHLAFPRAFPRGFPRGPALAAALGLLLALGIVAMLLLPSPADGAPAPGEGSPITTTPRPSTELALAAALVDALNQGDEDGVVALFDPDATLRMDRYAWMHHEIRLWARAQIAAALVIEPEGPFQAVANRALWTARVRRDDWRERGVESVRLANQILTEGDRIVDFSADPLDGASVTPLGNLWRPGSLPDPIPPLTYRRGLDQPRADEPVPVAPLAVPLGGVVGLLVAGAAHRLRSGATPRTRPPALIARLGDWQDRRQEGC